MMMMLPPKVGPKSLLKAIWVATRRCSQSIQGTKAPRSVVFSGIQPTGCLHLGNYFGAITQWVALQKDPQKECIFSIVDLHSITLSQNPSTLRANIRLMLACLLASGVDPAKCVLFKQSDVREHTQLCWVLACMTTMARLSHLPQYKEKSATLKDIPLGIYIYPVLQSADILLYKANQVPVGEDQLQHIQLAQFLSNRFNNQFAKLFPYPKPVLSDSLSVRIKSLRQPEKKMSKSEPDPKGRIDVTDTPDVIREKCKKAMTDFTSAVTFDPEKRPGVSNLILMHSLFSGLPVERICEDNRHLETAEYKLVVADVIIESLRPMRERVAQLLADESHLEQILAEGAEKATALASVTMAQVKEAIGATIN